MARTVGVVFGLSFLFISLFQADITGTGTRIAAFAFQGPGNRLSAEYLPR